MPRRGSVTALVLYMVGGLAILISLYLLTAPAEATFGPGLVSLLLGTMLIGLGRVCAHVARIRDLLEKRG
ncbi:hypothetical protein [Oleisolibacter albus]|uniref:hypothetical protein n=1 Tax=Oleisolibacter albus TaxID=2171757 RepID=UPI000DF1AE1F|nr:hypothetical protein [Oleisolibacter albus]